MEQLFPLIVGPVGALVLAVLGLYVALRVIRMLWQEHVRTDRESLADARGQRDAMYELAKKAVDAQERTAAALEQENRDRLLLHQSGKAAL